MIKKSIYTIAFRGAGALIAFFTSVFVANQLGLKNSGIFFFYVTAITVISSVFSFGFIDFYIKNISTKFENKQWDEINFILLISLVLSSFSILLLTNLAVGLIQFFAAESDLFYFSIANFYYSSVYMLLINLFTSFFQAIGRFRYSIFYQSILFPITFILSVYFAEHSSAVAAINSYVLAMKITALFMAIHGMKYLKLREGIKEVRLTGLTSFWTTKVVGVFVGNLSILLAGFIGDTSDVSMLTVCVRLVSVISLVLVTMNMMYSPNIAKLASTHNQVDLKIFINKITHLLIFFALPIVLFIFTFSKEVLLLFGPEFVQASFYLKILLTASLVNILVGPTGSVLNMSGFEKVYKNIILFSSVVYLSFLSVLCVLVLNGYQLDFTLLVLASAGYTFLINLLGFTAVRKCLGFYTLELSFVRKK